MAEEDATGVKITEGEEEPLAGITVSQSVDLYAAIFHTNYVASQLLRKDLAAAPDPLEALDAFDAGFRRYVAGVRPDPPESPDHGAERLYEAVLRSHRAKMEVLRQTLRDV